MELSYVYDWDNSYLTCISLLWINSERVPI